MTLLKAKELERIILAFDKTLEKTVAYNMPAFRTLGNEDGKGKILCCYLICKNHLGFYPYSGNILKLFDKEIKKLNLKFSTGALQLKYEEKLPVKLIQKILKLRKQEVKNNEIQN